MPKRRAIGQGSRPESSYGGSKGWPGRWQVGAAKRFRNKFSEYYPRGSDVSVGFYGKSYEEANSQQKDARKMTRFKGPGDYRKTWKKYRHYVPRGVGALGGLALGYGSQKGWDVGARASKAMGWGDYSMNQIISDSGVGGNPQQNVHHVSTITSNLSGDIIYSNTEFVQNVYATVTSGSSPFKVESLPINPALLGTFPFLSQIAQNFELYEFQGLMFQYKPTSGEFGSNNSNALGKVVLATNYDPTAPAFANSVVMENYDYSCSTKPSSGCIHGVECAPSQRATTQLYTRTGTSTKNKIFTDLGLFQIASEGIPSSVAQDILIGELWVTYTVKLSRAKLEQALGNSIFHGTYRGTGTADFGLNMANAIADSDNTVTCTFEDLSNVTTRLNFDESLKGKRVFLTMMLSVNLATGNRLLTSTTANCSVVYEDDSWEATTNAAILNAVIDIDQSSGDNTIILGTTTVPGTTTVIDISLTVVDPQFNLVIA